jgi:enamine deaminase RidA (YjgF/YER057c/UK114 family)
VGRVEERLEELGIALPEAPAPVAAYVSVVRSGDLVVTSGQLPWQAGRLVHAGKLGVEVSDEQGYEAARVCAINAIAQLKEAVGELDKIKQIVRVEGYVHSGAGFRGHPQVLNGASELLVEVFGAAGKHTRIALGTNEMPLDAPVQLVVWAAVRR